MKSTNLVLLGMAIILFAGVILQVNDALDVGVVFEGISVFCPFIGAAVSIFGAFKKD